MAREKEDSWWVEKGEIIAMCDGKCDGSNKMYATHDQTSQHENELHDSMVSIILYEVATTQHTIYIICTE